MALEILIAPASEPVTVAEVRTYLRLGSDGEDGVLATLITATRQLFEEKTGRALVSRTVRQRFSGPREPGSLIPGANSVTQIVAVRTLSALGVETVAPNGLVVLVDGNFVLTVAVPGLSIDYVAGFGTAASVPQVYKLALLEGIADALQRREGLDAGSTSSIGQNWSQSFSQVKL